MTEKRNPPEYGMSRAGEISGVHAGEDVDDTGIYLYAIAEDAGRAGPVDLTGVEGTAVRVIAHAGLVAYVSSVPLDRFGEEPLRRSLEDLDWVEETARAHYRVVEAVSEATPTAPVRLATVYGGEKQVRDVLDRRRADFLTVLSRVAGRREWGVKAYAGPAVSPSVGDAGDEDGAGADSPGKAYLKRRLAGLRGREERWREAVEYAERVHAALAAVAVADRRHRPQDPQLSGRQEWMVLNGAYLLEEGAEDEFARVLDTFRGPGIELELTGPWAPYSFVTVDLDTAEPEARYDG